jgi:FSR family fosmidomycin resistance protein-like MFS transporter
MLSKRTIFLSLGHGLNDGIAGFFLGSLASMELNPLNAGIAVTVYNILAFGGQYPVAIWLEKMGLPKKLILSACGFNVFALLCFQLSPQSAIVAAGIASAIYHVAGGTVCADKNKVAGIGLFAAPGVAGLIAGGLFAWQKVNIIPFFLLQPLFF